MKFSQAEIDADEKVVAEIAHAAQTAIVGSVYILGEGNDLDVLVRAEDANDAMDRLETEGYRPTGNPSGEEDDFLTLRKGHINVIVTQSQEFFDNFLEAAEVCKLLKLTSKQDRIAVHRVLMDGESAEVARAVARQYA